MRSLRAHGLTCLVALVITTGCGNGVLRGSASLSNDTGVLSNDAAAGGAPIPRLDANDAIASKDGGISDAMGPVDAQGDADQPPDAAIDGTAANDGPSGDVGPSGDAGTSKDSGAPPTPLNVLLITTDDLGLQLSAYGDTVIKTPNMDELAASGVQFDVAYVAQPSCSSSRSAMFTGLYVHSTGQYGLTNASDFGLHPHLHDAVMPNILKRAGYHTGIVGKLHVRPEEKFKFDEVGNYAGRDVTGLAQFADQVMNNAANAGKPFFLMVNYSDPHAARIRDPITGQLSPYTFLDRVNGIPAQLVQPSAKTLWPFQKADSPKQRARVAGYYNEVKRVDVGIGLLVDTLEEHGHAEDTLVILVGDHGPPFDRAKMTTYEAGLRIPFLVRWPGVSKAMKSGAMVSTVDILPTVLDATGAKPAVKMHGRSLRPVLSASNAPWRQYLAGEFHMHSRAFFPRRAMRDARYKLIHNLLAGKQKPQYNADGDLGYKTSREPRYDGTDVRRAFDTLADPPEWEFYDLKTDPWEFKNVAGKAAHKEAQKRLTQALLEWRKATDDPFLDPVFLDKLHKQLNE